MITKDWQTIIDQVLKSPVDDVENLVRATGLDPARDFRFADLRDVDFGAADLRGYDFSGADVRGANFSQALLDRAIFTDARLDAGNLHEIPAVSYLTYGPFHRIRSPTQDLAAARLQRSSGRIVGRGARQAGGGISRVPCVKAYVGRLPETEEGIEFMTTARPSSSSSLVGTLAIWQAGSAGVALEDDDRLASIPVMVTKFVYSDLTEDDQ